MGSVTDMKLVRSKQRVADHGEVFTPAWMVNDMLDLVHAETERIDSRVLEPACGSGYFVTEVLRRKLAAVDSRFGKSEFERRHYSLFGLMCVYGIELLADNVAECRESMVAIVSAHLGVTEADPMRRAAAFVVSQNIVHGDALTMQTAGGQPIVFAEWGYLGKGRFQRRDFRFDALAQMSNFGEDTLFGDLGKHEIFSPVQSYPPLTVEDLAGG